ncbi:general secretion pathway protein C [Salinisphaera sp. PC39]
MTGTVPANARRFAPYLPAFANALIVVMIGLAAARLFWLLWPVETTPLSGDFAVAGSRTATGEPVDVDTIAAAHLFGEKAAEAPGAADEVIDAPETRLNLTLTGIVSSRSGERSWALIRADGRDQSAYAVGDTVTSNVKLHAIYANRVILDRNGRYETLTLERDKRPEGAVRRVAGGERVTGAAAEELGGIRRQVLNDPATISQYIRLQPEREDGNLIGYRIYPGQERELFRELGLRPGELVTAINGVRLDNASRNMEVLRTLSEASSVTVTLERGGEQRTMTVSFQ